MEQIKWFERSFKCIYGPEYLPGLIERLRGMPVLLREKVSDASEAALAEQVDGKWSVKQNIFHLTALESLWKKRIKDICDEKRVLTSADLENKTTEEADLKERSSKELLTDFQKERSDLIFLYENLDESDLEKRSQHPRLKEPMRISDLAFFVAEHDTHHLLRIHEILNKKKVKVT